MINLTSEIKIICTNEQLQIAVADAIEDTKRLLLSMYAPDQERVSLSLITASRDNNYKRLAFNRYFPFYKKKYNAKWVASVFYAVHNNTRDTFSDNHIDILSSLGVDEVVPRTLAQEIWRGLRVFLLALWGRRAILLPMNFSLPETNRKKDYACQLYTEVLAIFRSPYVNGSLGVADISHDILPRSARNFGWYAWRPVIASDWHTVEDINTPDLIMLFKELTRRKNLKERGADEPVYPLAPASFLGPLISALPDRCNFDIKEVSIYNPRVSLDTDSLLKEVALFNRSLDGSDVRAVWAEYQKRYLTQVKEIKRKKDIKSDIVVIGKFNQYLFSILPQSGHRSPSPTEFDRKHMEGIGLPPLRQIISKRDDVSAIGRFFQYLEDVAPFDERLNGFTNPILDLDKPRESRRRQTSKKTFRINDFRLLFELVHAIGEFTWHVAKNIGEGTAPDSWLSILNSKNKYLILNADDFGFVPIVRFTLLDGTPVKINLRWIPTTVIPTSAVHLKGSPEKWTLLPNLHGIHQTIVGIETGLRHIHIRWLDKRNFKFSEVDSKSSTFDLLVNTDKVTNEWVRPTAKTVLNALERQIESQSWINGEHFDAELFYDYHELSDFGKIRPIFMKYNEPKVYTSSSMASFFRNIIYFFSLIKISLGQDVADKLPEEVSNLLFDNRRDFEKATRCRSKFSTDYTPHGLRASVVSIYAPILPPHVIGENITGHVSDNMVKYYTVINSDYISDVKAINRRLAAESGVVERSILAVTADDEFSSLRKAVAASPINDVLREYGAFSFATEEADGKIKSGMDAIKANDSGWIKICPTHICPMNNICPPEIVNTVGKKFCGQCHYSIKTVDHLPRILAHCRSLSRKCDDLKRRLACASSNGASEVALELIEQDLLNLTGELSAWMLTADVLVKNYDKLRNCALVNKPDILAKKLAMIAQPECELENILVQCDEAIAYPDLADSVLEADVAMIRARLLVMTGELEDFFDSAHGYKLIDSFRGLLRGVCMATGKSPKELAAYIESSPIKNIRSIELLEKLYE
ncbi:hypothetical protein [Vogesella fluminis]|uniref:Integrase n=1 Tax=Vogesella fluminis TaxID=1069161 RepID=A0ABQ3HDY3_9NEIS|nr:hypothetical protein [Vogesella fluminis]GHD80350.1 hypothetical protein GCM10011419_24950 [Vogesella fluminis]